MKEIIVEEKMLGKVYALEKKHELVRCKDCKYHGNIWPDYCVNLEQDTNDDFYCAFGERRTPE